MKTRIISVLLIIVMLFSLCSCKIKVKVDNPTQPTTAGGTEKPTAAPTETPTAPTDAPIAPTEAPTTPDGDPVDPTDAPAYPTDAPQAPTEEPKPTNAPVYPTSAPVYPTSAPVAPTKAPTYPTSAPDREPEEDEESDKIFELGQLTTNPNKRPDQYDSSVKDALELTMDIVYDRNSDITKEMYDRSVFREGNNARLKKLFEKAKAGEVVRISAIGGSITGGAAASSWDRAYGKKLAQWWEDQFPKSQIEYYNAGIGSTGSIIGAHRAYDDLLVHAPDLVIVDFSVNDSGTQTDKEAYESLLRQILQSENAPAVIAIGFMSAGGNSYQSLHEGIVEHYDLPYISYRDALWPEMEKGIYAWNEFYPDEIHPNNRGHKLAADLLIHYIAKEYLDKTTDKEKALPAPLYKNRFEDAKIYNNTTITPTATSGWKAGNNLYEAYNPLLPNAFKQGWRTTQNGSEITFQIQDARSLSIVYKRLSNPNEAGSVDIYLNGNKVKTLSSLYSAEYACAEELVLEDVAKDYTLTLVFNGTGNQRFDLLGIMVAK